MILVIELVPDGAFSLPAENLTKPVHINAVYYVMRRREIKLSRHTILEPVTEYGICYESHGQLSFDWLGSDIQTAFGEGIKRAVVSHVLRVE